VTAVLPAPAPPRPRPPRTGAAVGWPARTELRGVGGGLGPGPVRVLRVLGLHPGPSADTGAVAALAGLPRAGARTALATLVAANLVIRLGDRYAISDRLRAYAGEHPVPDAAAARARLLQHLAATATAAAEVAFPAGPAVTLPPFGSPAEARAWLDAERPTLLAIRDPAFARRLAPLLGRRSRSGAALLETALDRERAGRRVEALAWFAEAYELCVLTGDRLGQAVAAKRLCR
jgi:hypothetical protein